MSKIHIVVLMLVFVCGCETANAPVSESVANEADGEARLGAESGDLNDEAYELKEERLEDKILPAQVAPVAKFIADLGLAWQLKLKQDAESSVLGLYEVPINERNFKVIKEILADFDKQMPYAEKLLFKDFLLEAYELEDEILDSNFSERYPAHMRELSAVIFKESHEAHRQAQVAINTFVIRKSLERIFKEHYLSGEPTTLAEINFLYNVCEQLRGAIRFFEDRHDGVHELFAKNNELKKKLAVDHDVTFLIEEHPYWTSKDYIAKPNLQNYFGERKKNPKLKPNSFNYGISKYERLPNRPVTPHLWPGQDITYLRGKYPEETKGLFSLPPSVPDQVSEEFEIRHCSESKPPTAAMLNLRLLDTLSERSPSDKRHNLMSSWNQFNNETKHTFVNALIQDRHTSTFGFLNREGGELLGGDWRTSSQETLYPRATELVMHELACLSPAPSKSEYVKEFDEKIQFLKQWIENRGDR